MPLNTQSQGMDAWIMMLTGEVIALRGQILVRYTETRHAAMSKDQSFPLSVISSSLYLFEGILSFLRARCLSWCLYKAVLTAPSSNQLQPAPVPQLPTRPPRIVQTAERCMFSLCISTGHWTFTNTPCQGFFKKSGIQTQYYC